MNTLQEAIAHGQGVERPFRCTEHNDTQASASVNVVKGVWFCHSCHAKGRIDGKTSAPKIDDLRAMMDPEAGVRVYPRAWLELFGKPVYWLTRFPGWVCHAMGLGHDPFTRAATFPVNTPSGLLAGVGRRFDTQDKHSRYLYPKRWSASSTMFGTGGKYPPLPVLALVEGAADATACWEVGCPALAVYGSGMHLPQRDLLVRYNPKLILLGFDADAAGDRATISTAELVGNIAPTVRVDWPGKDPAACVRSHRRSALMQAVRMAGYGVNVTAEWDRNIARMKHNYEKETADGA